MFQRIRSPRPDPAVGLHQRRRRGGVMKLVLFALVSAVISIASTGIGWLHWSEILLTDHLAFNQKRQAGGAIILAVADDQMIRETGRFPYDRATLAKALDRMREAGILRIYIDSSLSHRQDEDGDRQLDDALSRLGPERVALPVSRNGTIFAHGKLEPLERFSRHATLVSLDFAMDADTRTRGFSKTIWLSPHTAIEWLTGKAAWWRQDRFSADLSITETSFPRWSIAEIARGEVPDEALRNKLVIFGTTAETIAGKLGVPGFRRISRPELAAIAAETLESGHKLTRPALPERFVIAVTLALLLGLIARALSPAAFLAVTALAIPLWWLGSVQVFKQSGYISPLTPLLMIILIYGHRALFSTGPVIRVLTRTRRMLFGIDQATLRLAVDAMPDAAFLFHDDGTIFGWNAHFATLHAELLGSDHPITSLKTSFERDGSTTIASEGAHSSASFIVSLRSHANAVRSFEIFPRQLETSGGAVWIAGLKDVTERMARENELVTLAFKDALTGLSNRLAFKARIENACLSGATAPFAVLMLDLDGFKKVNDTLGHDAGDQLLIGVAKRLSALVPEQAVLARLGGDEFAILVPFEQAETIRDLAQDIHHCLRPEFQLDGKTARVGTSIGISYAPRDGHDARLLLKRADLAMYRAKRNKPSSCEFDTHLDETEAGQIGISSAR